MRGGDIGVVVSKGSGVVFCSEHLHWTAAGTAGCLPMAQLFANLSLLLPHQLAFGAPSSRRYPFPFGFAAKKKNNRDLILPTLASLPLFPAADVGGTRDKAVWDLIKRHEDGSARCTFTSTPRPEHRKENCASSAPLYQNCFPKATRVTIFCRNASTTCAFQNYRVSLGCRANPDSSSRM